MQRAPESARSSSNAAWCTGMWVSSGSGFTRMYNCDLLVGQLAEPLRCNWFSHSNANGVPFVFASCVLEPSAKAAPVISIANSNYHCFENSTTTV